jgi:pyruvate kinase
VFNRISRRIEHSGGAGYHERADFTSPRQKLAKSAVVMADELRADAILVFTVRGNMARHTAWMRPRYSPIYAFCPDWAVADGLSLSWGVTPMVIPFDHAAPERTIDNAITELLNNGTLKRGHTVVIISSISAGDKTVDAVQMRQL